MPFRAKAINALMRWAGWQGQQPPRTSTGRAGTIPDFQNVAGAVNKWYTQETGIPEDRLQRYREMDALDEDELLSSALDLVAEDTTRQDIVSKRVIWVASANKEIEDIANRQTLRRCQSEARAFQKVRAMCKYGDYFDAVRQGLGDGTDLPGYIWGTRPFLPYWVEVIQDEWGRVQAYSISMSSTNDSTVYQNGPQSRQGDELQPWELIHYKLPGRELLSPYGTPYLLVAKRPARQLQMMENSMTIHRIMRSPDRLKWKVFTGGAPVDEVGELLNLFKNQVTKKYLYDPDTGQAKHEIDPRDLMSDIYVPWDGTNGTDVEILRGSGVIGNIVDVDYIRKKVFSAIRIPGEYMGFEEPKGTLNGNSPLAEQQDRYSNTVGRVQKSYMEGEITAVKIDLVMRGIDINRPENEFRVVMPPVSYLGEQRASEAAKIRAGIVSELLSVGKDLGIDSVQWRTFVGRMSGFPEDIANMISGDEQTEEGKMLNALAGKPEKADKVRTLLESMVKARIRYASLSSREESIDLPLSILRKDAINEWHQQKNKAGLNESGPRKFKGKRYLHE